MAEINVEKVSSIKTVMSFNHRAEIILKAGVNIPHPVARRIRSPRDEDFESAPLPVPGLFCIVLDEIIGDNRNDRNGDR
jgi:hypothetical protein